MTREVTDQLYIELDYFTPEEYYVYTAEAVSAISSEFTVTAEGTLIGQVVEASADLSSEATISAVIDKTAGFNSTQSSEFTLTTTIEKIIQGNSDLSSESTVISDVAKIIDAQADFTSEFTQQCTLSNIYGIDMFAFSEAAIAIEISRIRDNNIDLSTEFSVAIDFVKIIQGLSDQSSEFALSSDASRFRIIESDLSSEYDQSITFIRNRDNSSELQVAFSFSATAQKTIDIDADLSAEFQFNIIAFAQQASADLVAVSSIYASRNMGGERPKPLLNATSPPTAAGGYNSTYKKFGTHSINLSRSNALVSNVDLQFDNIGKRLGLVPALNQSFMFEIWFYYASYTTSSTAGWGQGLNEINSNWWIRPVANNAINLSPGTSLGIIETTANDVLVPNQWNHILLVGTAYVLNDYTALTLYVNGDRVAQTNRRSSLQTDYRYFRIGLFQTGSNIYADDISYHIGSTMGYDKSETTITVPTERRANDPTYTRFLWHVDNNNFDDVGITQTYISNQSATTTLSTSSAITADVDSAMSSEFQLQAVVGKLEEIVITAFDQATLTADATIIAENAASLSAQASLSSDIGYLIDFSSDQNSQATIAASVNAIFDHNIQTDSVASVLSVVVKTGDVIADLSSEFQLSCAPQELQGFVIAFDTQSTLSADINNIKQLASDISAEFTLFAETIDSLNKQAEAQLSNSASLSADFVRTRDVYIGYAGDRTAKTVTTFGNVEISTAQAKFGSGSALITDTGDYFTVSGDSTLYNGNFTVELFLWGSNLTQTPNGTIWDNRTSSSNGMYLYVSYGSIGLYEGITGKGLTSAGFNNSQWNHIALVRSGNNAKVFVNGVQKISATVTTTNYSNRTTYIGTAYNGLVPMRGYYDEVRLSASARYLSGFTPTTSAYVNDSETSALLHLDIDFSDDIAAVPGPEIESTVTATNIRIREANIDIDGVFSDSTLAVKAATGISDMYAETAMSVIIGKIQQFNINLTSETALQADGTTNIVGEVAMSVTAGLSIVAVKTVDASTTNEITATLTAIPDVTRLFAALVVSFGTLTVDAQRSRSTGSDNSSQALLGIDTDRIRSFECNFGSLFAPSISVRKIYIDIYVYKIPREIRTYRVSAETREYSIPEETRIYTIRR